MPKCYDRGMQIPYRKPGPFSLLKPDPLMTKEKYVELQNKLNKLKKMVPQQAEEVSRLADLGDFSENVAYQFAKGRLRGINQSILEIESRLLQASIIVPQNQTNAIQIGHTVTIERDNKQVAYKILGSSETNPHQGIISHHSPLGVALIGQSVGDTIAVKINNQKIFYKIIKIE